MNLIDAVHEWWSQRSNASPSGLDTARPAVVGGLLTELTREIAPDLPHPGSGCTDGRFDVLAAIGGLDLTVGRLMEAHADAMAILSELNPDGSAHIDGAIWGVWAAEPPAPVRAAATPARVLIERTYYDDRPISSTR